MTSALTWFGEMMQTAGKLLPRIRHLECTDIGVCIKRGRRVKVLKPGIHIFWPIWTSFYCRPGNVQTADLPPQSLTTLDYKVVAVGGMLRYEFNRHPDAVTKALINTDDVEGAIIDEAMAVFCAFITSKPMVELTEERVKTNRSLTGKLTTRLAEYGVRVLRAQLTDFSPCITLNHVGIPKHIHEEEYEE
ncbi:MAG: SPFH domain-containing protein [bacterium]|nr:SPFH domain-containing protein [bacterium]